MTRSRARRSLLVLIGYFLLALVLTFPLVLRWTTHVPGDGSDDPALAWNLWWVPHALIDLGQNPLYTNSIFYPIGVNLAYYTLTPLNAFLSIPLQYVLGLVPAANLYLWLSFSLSGFGAYLLARHLLIRGGESAGTSSALAATRVEIAAWAAGLLYAFSSNKFLYASLGQFNIASSQWIPFYVLYLVKLFPLGGRPRGPALRSGLLLGVFLLLQASSELIFASFLLLFTIVYLAYWLALNRRSLAGIRDRVPGLIVAGLVFVVPLSPILAAMWSDLQAEGDFLQSGLGFANSFSADLVGFFVPSRLSPLFGGLDAQFHFAYINFVYLGLTALALAGLALWRVPRARIWGVWFTLVWLVSLGPTLRVNGAEYNLPFLPFNLLLEIPFVKGNRYPSRWSVMLTLFLAVMVAFGIEKILNSRFGIRDSRQGDSQTRFWNFQFAVPVVLCLALVGEHVSALPLDDFRIPPLYQTIAQDPGDFAVMELPLTWRNGFRVTGSYRPGSQGPIDREFMLAQWYQTAHGHPILNGNTSRNPENKFQYFAETPVIDSLVAIQTGHTPDEASRARDRALAPRVLQFFHIRYIVWHTPYEEVNREVANRTRAYVEQVFPVSKVAESYENGRGTALYRVNDLPAGDSLTLRPNDPLARLYFAEGWSAVGQDRIWAERREARVLFPVERVGDYRLTIPAPFGSGSPDVKLTLNGQLLPPDPATAEFHTIIRDLPATYLHSGVNELDVSFGGSLPLPVSILVRSAGEEQGNFGHIYVNGVDQSPGEIGYNLVVVDVTTGSVRARENFNTFASADESARLAAFVGALPAGSTVAVAAQDEASSHLTAEAVTALQSLGSGVDLRGKFRWSHALIGVKGAAPGTALEAAAEWRVSQVITGIGATAPQVSGWLAELVLENK